MNFAWLGFLEFFVAIHGVAVALMNGQEVWTMFLFGFLFMTVFTHIHGLKLASWVRFLILAGFLVTLFMTLYGVPKAKATVEDLVVEMAASNVDIGLKERTFNDSFDDVMLYVNKIDVKNKALIDVFMTLHEKVRGEKLKDWA